MQALKVTKWEWVLVEKPDRRGNMRTVYEKWPVEYQELPYRQIAVELPEEDEVWLNFGGE